MAQPHVPTSLDQITAEVMTDALRSSGFDEVTVSSVSAERIAIGEGFLGELARLTLDYSAGTGRRQRSQDPDHRLGTQTDQRPARRLRT